MMFSGHGSFMNGGGNRGGGNGNRGGGGAGGGMGGGQQQRKAPVFGRPGQPGLGGLGGGPAMQMAPWFMKGAPDMSQLQQQAYNSYSMSDDFNPFTQGMFQNILAGQGYGWRTPGRGPGRGPQTGGGDPGPGGRGGNDRGPAFNKSGLSRPLGFGFGF